jgi:hypothetical protein
MAGPLIDTPDALDAATATAVRVRREKLLQIAAGKGTKRRVAYGLIVLIAVCALSAFFAGDRRAAAIIGIQACWVLGFVFIADKAARRKAQRELQEMKPST